jgi:Fur family transcriptional regulator, ferric uptake regulator
VNQAHLRNAFERFLRTRSLKFTPQRVRIFDRAFATHEHFTAERLYRWLEAEEGPAVSRATVYRTLTLLVEGRFLESLDTGRGELYYEHVLGHRHHDHMVCLDCGRIEEFYDERIEELQALAAEKKGFQMVGHDLKLTGYCRACVRKRGKEGAGGEADAALPAAAKGALGTKGPATSGRARAGGRRARKP